MKKRNTLYPQHRTQQGEKIDRRTWSLVSTRHIFADGTAHFRCKQTGEVEIKPYHWWFWV